MEARCIPSETWEEDVFMDLLEQQQFADLMPSLKAELDHNRNTKAFDIVMEQGCDCGHVPMLYLVVRNYFKYSTGHLHTTRRLTKGLMLMFVAMLRTAQDMAACYVVFGDVTENNAFEILTKKFWKWLDAHDMTGWPTVADVVHKLKHHIERNAAFHSTLPPPVWSCHTHWHNPLSYSIVFGNVPKQKVQAAQNVASSLETIRVQVTSLFLQRMEGMDWDKLRELSIESLIGDYVNSMLRNGSAA